MMIHFYVHKPKKTKSLCLLRDYVLVWTCEFLHHRSPTNQGQTAELYHESSSAYMYASHCVIACCLKCVFIFRTDSIVPDIKSSLFKLCVALREWKILSVWIEVYVWAWLYVCIYKPLCW